MKGRIYRVWAVVVLGVTMAWEVSADTQAFGWRELLDVAISPEGDVAAAAGVGGSVVFLSYLDEGWSASLVIPCGEPTVSLLFSHDGTRLFTLHDDGSLREWNLGEEKPPGYREVFSSHMPSPGGLALGPGGEFIAVGHMSGGVAVVHLPSRQVVASTESEVAGIALTFVSRDELAIGTPDGKVYLWRLSGEPRLLYSHQDFVNKLAYHPTGYLASASDDKTAVVYDLSSGEIVAEFRLPNYIRALAFSLSGNQVVLGSYREAVVWDFVEDQVVARVKVGGWVSGLAYDPRGRGILLVTWEGEIIWWNPESGHVSPVPGPELGGARAVSPDCNLLATEVQGFIRLYRLPTLDLLGEVPLESDVWDIAWLPRRNAFATLGTEGICLYEVGSPTPRCLFQFPVRGSDLCPSPDGRFLAVEGWDVGLVCNLDDGNCRDFSLPGYARAEVVVSPGGKRAAVLFAPQESRRQTTLLIWSADSGESTHYPAVGINELVFWGEDLVLIGPRKLRILHPGGTEEEIPFSPGWPPVCAIRDDGVLACGNAGGEVFLIDLNRPDLLHQVDLYDKSACFLTLCDCLLVFEDCGGVVIIYDLPDPFIRREQGS